MKIAMKYSYIPKKKRKGLSNTLIFIVIIMVLQLLYPESLISCMAAVMVIVSIYINMENPSIRGLEHYHHEMVMGFATLVENKDDNTGGHIRRFSAYAVLIAKNLQKMAGTDIPLCARIMAVADVFDAVSAKQCYRDAMPLKECYQIILNGRDTDFDPDVVDAFMMDKEKIEEIYYSEIKQ